MHLAASRLILSFIFASACVIGTPHNSSARTYSSDGGHHPAATTSSSAPRIKHCQWALSGKEWEYHAQDRLGKLRKVLPNHRSLSVGSREMQQGRLSQYRNFLQQLFSRESLNPLSAMSSAAQQFRGALNEDLRRDAFLTAQILKQYPARVRTMNCLEYLMTSTFLQPVKDQDGPVDFFAIVLSSVPSHRDLLIYAVTEQRTPWQPHATEEPIRLRDMLRKVEEDLVGRWQIQSVIHAHPMRHDHIAKISSSSLAPTEADRKFLQLNRHLFQDHVKWISLDYLHALELSTVEILELAQP